MIAGLELPTRGRIFLGGEDVTWKRASQRDIAFVFQLFALYPHLNVRRNIAFPLVAQGMPRKEIAQQGRRGGAHPADHAPARPAGLGACRPATGSGSRSAARSCASRSPS